MIERILDFSIRRRGLVLVLACMVLIYGVHAALGAKLDVFPDFQGPRIVIKTAAPGLSPREVEQLVSRPIEQAISGLPRMASLKSKSVEGLSKVVVVFHGGTDVMRDRQRIAERLGMAANQLPVGTGPPLMAPLKSTTATLLLVGLTSDTRSQTALADFARWTVRPALLAVPGVADMATFGGQVRQLQIQIRPDRLAAFGLSVNDVTAAARRATGMRGAGFIDTPGQRILLEADAQALTPQDLGAVPLRVQGGSTVRIRDVAHVAWGHAPELGAAAVMGRPGVVLTVSSQLGANMLETTRAVERTLGDLEPAARREGIVIWPSLFEPADFVTTAIGNLDSSLLIGAVLVAVVLFAFLWNARSAAVSLAAIPLSLLAALAVLVQSGATLNTMTLGGLAIAIGEVVDDAVIDVENVHRRLEENRCLARPRPASRVILDACLEVRSSVVFATFVVILVFVPVLLMSGLQGRLFGPLGLAYILAVLASLLVALTLTPALCCLLLARSGDDRLSPFMPPVRARYERLLAWTMDRPRIVMGTSLALVVGAAAAMPFLGGSFLPRFHEGQFIVHMSAAPGTSLEESLRLGRPVMRALMRDPDVRYVAQTVGTTERAADLGGTGDSEFDVSLAPGVDALGAEARIRKMLRGFPGVRFDINSFLKERINETMSGNPAPVAIEVFGGSQRRIDEAARRVAQVLAGQPGARRVKLATKPGVPILSIRFSPEKLAQFGLLPVDALDALQTIYQGSRVGQVHANDRAIDVVVTGDPALRTDPLSVGRLLLRTASGQRVPLSSLAQIRFASERSMILHDGGRREQTVTCRVKGGNVSGFVAGAKRAIASRIALPSGVYLHFSGAAEARAQAQRQLLLYSGLAAVGIVLLLSMAFGNGHNLLLVLVNVPFALVGGVLAVYLTGAQLSIGSLVGFVTLFGITTRNSIMLLSRYHHLCSVQGLPWSRQAALLGATERLSPILMTALVTGLGLLPIALGSRSAGREVEGPMAVVILGGLLTSCALNLLVLPTLALRFGRFGPATADPAVGLVHLPERGG